MVDTNISIIGASLSWSHEIQQWDQLQQISDAYKQAF